MRAFLLFDSQRSVSARSSELAAWRRALAQFTEAVGSDVIHPRVARLVATCDAKLGELRDALLPFDPGFIVPEPSADLLDLMRTRFDWEALDGLTKKAPAADPFKWLPEKDKAELAEAEQRWVAEARLEGLS